jgi:hypothetical protein
VTIDHFAIAANQTRNLKAKLTNAAAHAIHRRIVLARVARIKDQPVDGPGLDFHGHFRRHHDAPFLKLDIFHKVLSVAQNTCLIRLNTRSHDQALPR